MPGNSKHGLSHHPAYFTWRNMISRCYNRRDKHYHDYGGRGIKVCDRWRGTPTAFIKWAHDKFKKGLTLDRADNDGDYNPNNCRFVGMSVQSKNKRVFKNNKTGISGVCLRRGRMEYEVTIGTKYIGRTKDLFEACCMRKSAEVKHEYHT